MVSPWLGILLVLSVFGAALAGLATASPRLHYETARKTLHVGMGLVTLALPWLFDESWPVMVLAATALAALVALRSVRALRRYGSVLHTVRRDSFGEFHFVLGACALFLLTRGNDLFYFIPMLILTFADAIAAVVGIRYGTHPYAFGSARKSLEGSLAFFATAFVCVYVPLVLLTPDAASTCTGIALTVAAVATVCEAVAGRGLDNLLVPLAAYAALAVVHDAGAAAPAARACDRTSISVCAHVPAPKLTP